MVLFNGGGGWSDRALEQLWVRRPSKQEQDLVIFPTPPGKTFATDLGLRGHSFQIDVSCTPASSEPLTSHGQEEGECAAGCFCHKRTLCLSYK